MLAFAGSSFATVTVTVTGLGGADSRVIGKDICRSSPTTALPIVIAGALTVAVIDWKVLGVVKPSGVPALIVVVPRAAGSNATFLNASPPAIVALPTMVPTAVFELVTGTFTVSPPRSSCVDTHASVVGWSRAASTLSVVFTAKVFVVMSFEFRTNPDGSTVTLLVPSL